MQIRKKHFTLFELLISLVLLVMVATVVLRMLATTGELWNYTNEQTDLYMNSKVLFNALDEELSGIVYNYQYAGNAKGLFAPLYVSNNINVGSSDFIKAYNSNELEKGTALCFVTHTRRDNNSENSDICKVGYIYFPPRAESNTDVYSMLNDTNVFSKKNGVLVRVILDETDYGDSEEPFAGAEGSDAKTVSSYFDNGSSKQYFDFDLSHAQQVIEGVIDFRVEAYKYDAIDNSFSEADHNDDKGMEAVDAICIRLTMLPPERLEEFRREDYQTSSEDVRRDFLQKHARTFVRTFWIRSLAE